jgi:SagB-type dehydrogenase family enzyme
MKKYSYILFVFGLILLAAVVFRFFFTAVTPTNNLYQESVYATVAISDQNPGTMINLPEPVSEGTMSLEETLLLRRSVRSYRDAPMNLQEVSQLLWSAQGITNERGFRTAPSAGATFPLELFVVVNNVEGLAKGIYHYSPHQNRLEMIRRVDVASDLARASLSQSMLADGGIVIVFAAEFERTTQRYGERGIRYVHNEIGHASQNVHLQAAAMNLGTVVIGAYRDEEVEAILKLDDELRVLYMMPVGKI